MIISIRTISFTLKSEYDLDVESINALSLGADPSSKIFIVKTVQNENYFLKLKSNHNYDIIIELIDFLNQSGLKNIILPIKTNKGQSNAVIGNASVILYPFIKGENAFNTFLTEKQWIDFGQSLKLLHSLKIPLKFQQKIRKETFSDHFRNKVKELLNNAEPLSKIKDDISLQYLELIQNNAPFINKF